MIQTNTLRSEATDGHSYNCEGGTMGMGKNHKTRQTISSKSISHDFSKLCSSNIAFTAIKMQGSGAVRHSTTAD